MIKARDLFNIISSDFEECSNEEIFLCLECGSEAEGIKGEFFMLSDDNELRCPYCNKKLLSLRQVKGIRVLSITVIN